MKLTWRRIRLALTLLIVVLIGQAAPLVTTADGIPDYRFGVIESYDAPAAASALGAGWTRVTFRWNEIQTNGSGEWNPPISDRALNGELARGRQVVGLLVTTPGWATDMGKGAGVPQGLYLPPDAPNNQWANFVRKIVGQYAGRIDHWIIWNEPDIPDTQHMSWGGSVEDFVQLLRVAYIVAKQTNPNAVIHMSAVTHWWNEDWFGQFLDTLVADPGAAEHNHYFDAMTLHVYFQPETVYDLTAHYYGLMRNRGLSKPIWIVETNAAPSNDPAWPVPNAQFNVSLDQQAYYIVQAFSLGIAAGAQRIAVYKMIDTETDRAANPEPFGLVRMDGSRRPAFTAYQVATNYLSGFRGGSWERRDDIAMVIVDRGDETTTVAWSRGPQPQTAMIPARTTRALLVDVWGSARYIYPERGYYYVELPGADCSQGCLIGGAPYMVVEGAPASADTAPPPSSPTPPPITEEPLPEENGERGPTATTDPNALPTPTPSFTPTPTPTATSTPTATPTPTDTPTPTATPTPTPTATPTSTPTATPTATPVPLPVSRIPPRRPWTVIGILALVMGGATFLADRKRRLDG